MKTNQSSNPKTIENIIDSIKIEPWPGQESNKERIERVEAWSRKRTRLEGGMERFQRKGNIADPIGHEKFMASARNFLDKTPFGKIGRERAINAKLNRFILPFKKLPKSFDGFRILHVSDPHFDCLPDLTDRLIDLLKVELKGETLDLVAFTGDYIFEIKHDLAYATSLMSRFIRTLKSEFVPKGRVFATLGNHDSIRVASAIEIMGARLLVNETLSLEKNGEKIFLTGVDDVHYFRTGASEAALIESPNIPNAFKIALVHSPDLYHLAAEHKFSFYLAGHTHGGQFCLPGEIPIFLNMEAPRKYGRGLWKYKEMRGYTNCGAGTAGIPMRFFSQSEMALFTLKST